MLARLEIETEPVAAASIGQVHRARVKATGQALALKIQYPGVDEAVDTDLKLLKFILNLSEIVPRGPRFDQIFQACARLGLPVMNLDVLPTVVTAAGGKPESSWRLDGVDLTPFVTGANPARPHPTLYWRYGAQWAVRHGDLKLVGTVPMSPVSTGVLFGFPTGPTALNLQPSKAPEVHVAMMLAGLQAANPDKLKLSDFFTPLGVEIIDESGFLDRLRAYGWANTPA